MDRIVLIIALLLILFNAESQAQKTLLDYDKSTYDLFLSKKWDALIEEGNRSLEKGFDFYYLRIRMGIAYYENENYISAIPHFEKALEFIPKDSTACEYLYYSNILLGRKSEVFLASDNLPYNYSRKSSLIKPEFFEGLYTEGGFVLNSSLNNSGNGKGLPMQTQGILEVHKQLKNYRYNNISLIHRIGNRISLFHGFGNISINNSMQFSSLLDGSKEYDVKTNQWDYYFSADVNAGSGLGFTGFLHYLNVNVEDVKFSVDTSSGFPKAEYTNFNTKYNELLGGLGINYSASYFQFSNTISASNFNSANQIQNTFRLIYYPLGNLNLYVLGDLTGHFQKEKGEKKYTGRFLWAGKVGFKLSDDLWAEAFYTGGEIQNYIEENGYIVYNNFNIIKRKLGINLILPVSPDVELSLRYQNYEQESYKLIYSDTQTYTTNLIKNINHSIIGGIKWTF